LKTGTHLDSYPNRPTTRGSGPNPNPNRLTEWENLTHTPDPNRRFYGF